MTDTLLDLHAKLSTVVRYYDRMLEERLSNTYSQHTSTPYSSSQQVHQSTSAIYPSFSSGITNGSGRAESFYTGNTAPPTNQDVAMTYPYTYEHRKQSRQAVPLSPRLSNPKGSIGNPAGYFQSSLPEQLYHQTNSYASPLSVQGNVAAADAHWNGPGVEWIPQSPSQLPPLTDRESSYYHGGAYAAQPAQSLSSPQAAAYDSPHRSQPPIYQQPSQVTPSQQLQQRQAPSTRDTPQRRHDVPSTHYPAFGGYTQDSFPSIPQHQPEPKPVEESLIDL